VGKSFSLADTLKNTHKALNENRMEFYAIPGDKKLMKTSFFVKQHFGFAEPLRLKKHYGIVLSIFQNL